MTEVDGFQLEAFARPDHPGSEHFWPCVRVVGPALNVVHGFLKESLPEFDSKDKRSVIAAAEVVIAKVNSVTHTDLTRVNLGLR